MDSGARDFPEAPYFVLESAEEFTRMETEPDDVIMVSYPKCGTTWVHLILYGLLRVGVDGTFDVDPKGDLGASGQVYPEGVQLRRDGASGRSAFAFSYEDLMAQRRPRLVTTHTRRDNLPRSLLHRGRLIFVLRNPKDAFVSWKFFVQAMAKFLPTLRDLGWQEMYDLYNRTEVSTSHRWGDYYSFTRDMSEFVELLGVRATFVFYERLHEDFVGEVSRLANFLGVPFSEAKLQTVARLSSAESLSREGMIGNGRKPSTLRTGVVGDHKQYLSDAHWSKMDDLFRSRLGHISALQPLHQYMGGSGSTQSRL